MKIFRLSAFTLAFAIISGGYVQSHAQGWEWGRSAGGTQYDIGRGIAVDELGNSYVIGFFNGSITLGQSTFTSAGGFDVFIASYSPTGEVRWAKHGGGSHDDFGERIVIDRSGNLYVTGQCTDTFRFDDSPATITSGTFATAPFVASFTTDGTLRWARSFEGNGRGFGMHIQEPDTLFLTGSFGGGLILDSIGLNGSPTGNIFVASLDLAGNVRWARGAIGTTATSAVRAGVATASDGRGNLYVTGYLADNTGFGHETFDTIIVAAGISNIFLARYNSTNGNIIWVRTAGGSNYDAGTGLLVDQEGEIYICGYYQGSSYFSDAITLQNENGLSNSFVARYNADGDVVWVRGAGGAASDEAYAMTWDRAGDIAVTGKFGALARFGSDTLTCMGESNVFAALYTREGALLGAVSAEGTGDDHGNGIAAGADGRLWIVGDFSASTTFSPDIVSSNGLADLFVATLRIAGADVDVERGADDFTLAPNPSRGHLHLRIPSQPGEDIRIRISAMTGETISETTFVADATTFATSIDLSNSPAGVYAISIGRGDRIATRMVTIVP